MVRRMIPCCLNPPCMQTGAGSKESKDFFSKFHVSESQPRWLDPVTRHSPVWWPRSKFTPSWKKRPDKSEHKLNLSCYSQNKFVMPPSALHLGFWLSLPTSQGPPSLITKPEFRNMLATLSFHMQDEEFEKLWKRYTTCFQQLVIRAMLQVCLPSVDMTQLRKECSVFPPCWRN